MQSVSLSSILRKIMESALLEAVSGHMKEVFGNSQCGFTEGKWCLANLIAFCSEMSRSGNEGRTKGVTSLDFGNSFDLLCNMENRVIGCKGCWLKFHTPPGCCLQVVFFRVRLVQLSLLVTQIGDATHSSHLQTPPNRAMQSVCSRVWLLLSRTPCRGFGQECLDSLTANGKFCPWDKLTSCPGAGWGLSAQQLC